jgi:hypothetical protein
LGGHSRDRYQAIKPMNDRERSLRRLDFENVDFIEAGRFFDRLRNGRSVFKRA